MILILTEIFNFVIFMLGYQFPLAITPISRPHDVLGNIINLLFLFGIWDLKIPVANQYSENPKDREAWWTTVHRVAKVGNN